MYVLYKRVVIAACFIFLLFESFAQSDGYHLNGWVLSIDSLPLENATIQLLPTEETVIAGKNGWFEFKGLSVGSFQLSISITGYVPTIISVQIPQDQPAKIYLQRRIVGLLEISVIAKSKQLGSSSVIDRSAIIHTQPTSLADVLQLVPGQLAVNPNLGSVNQVNLRQGGANTDAARANALGTQIVLDGVPLSNNANLQTDVTILNSSPSASPPFSSAAGMGNDLRQIPADNIESVEVIRGIPSVKYGDLTSGLIIVNSRIGNTAPELRIRLNPNLMQAAFVTGFDDKFFGKSTSGNTYNVSVDLLNAKNDVRDPFNQYTRLQSQLSWRRAWNPIKTFVTTTIISGYNTIDKLKQDPDDERYQSKHYSDEKGFKASTEGNWKINKPWISNVYYISALTYNRQQSFYQTLITRDLFPLSDAMTDTTKEAVYGKSEYLNQTTVDGRPINGYARLELSLVKKIGKQTHRFLLGSEWRMDVNKGRGRHFDPLMPPRQNYSMGDRPRSYAAIPAIHQLAYYAEDRMSFSIGRQKAIVQAGVRLDNFVPEGVFKSKYRIILAPRMNAAIETFKDTWIRVGYGTSAKTPALNHLYPGTRYFDLVNFNYFARDPAERLVILTTRTIPLDDRPINPYTVEKWEAGLDIEKRWLVANISFFYETTRGAVGFNRELKPFSYDKYRILETPVGRPPVLDPVPLSVDTFFAAYDIPVNNRIIINKGVEYSFTIPEISSIRTSFNVTGAYYNTESFDDGTVMDTDKAYQGMLAPSRVGVYYTSSRIISERLNTSIRFIHRVPQLNLIFSALWQTIWLTKNKPVGLSELPVAYIDKQGKLTALTQEEAALPQYGDMRRTVSGAVVTHYPPLHLFNIQLTKEWKGGYGFSFRVNNFLNYRPLHFNQQTNALVRRNEPLFFAAEFNVSLGNKKSRIVNHNLLNN